MSNDSSSISEQPEFSKLRKTLLPIHNYELKKFIPMSLMMMFILYIYTIFRDIKDPLVSRMAVGGNAAMLTFIKTYIVFPSSIIFMAIFIRLSNKLSKERLFYVITLFFISFFVLFCLVLFPCTNLIHMSKDNILSWKESLKSVEYFGGFLQWLAPMIGNWSYTLFFVMAELWGSVVLTALFWQFVNMITKITETKRFYPMFALIGNIGLLFSGLTVKLGAKQPTFAANLRMIGWFTLISGVALLVTYKWIQKYVLTDPRLYDSNQEVKKKKKANMGFLESMKFIFTTPYFLKLTMLMVGYGFAINLFEQIWKAQILVLPGSGVSKDDAAKIVQSVMGNLSIATGIITMIMTIVGVNVVQKFKWRTAALVTPISMSIICGIFFVLAMSGNVDAVHNTYLIAGITCLAKSAVFLSVYVGLFANAIGKGVKYSLFDSTLQMAYMPLDSELKTKGQAAVSIIGGRLGKSGGALFVSTLIGAMKIDTPLDAIGIIASVFFVVVALWILSVISLSGEYEQKMEECRNDKNQDQSPIEKA